MRILVLLAMAIVLSTRSAAAEWVKTGSSDISTYYIDYGTIVRNGGHVWMTNLTDYPQPQAWQGHAFLSSTGKAEYDCTGARYRIFRAYGTGAKDLLGSRSETMAALHSGHPW